MDLLELEKTRKMSNFKKEFYEQAARIILQLEIFYTLFCLAGFIFLDIKRGNLNVVQIFSGLAGLIYLNKVFLNFRRNLLSNKLITNWISYIVDMLVLIVLLILQVSSMPSDGTISVSTFMSYSSVLLSFIFGFFSFVYSISFN